MHLDRIVLTAAELRALQDGHPVHGYTAAGLIAALGEVRKDASDLSDPNPVEAAHVIAVMEKNFPLKALSWVKHGAWHGPVHVPMDRIDFGGEDSWAASHQPDAVDRFARQMKAGEGQTHPVILVQSPEHPKAIVVDGHHRTLAARKLGWPVKAYLGTFDRIPQAALETHSFQVHSGGDPSNKAAALDLSEAQAAELVRQIQGQLQRQARKNRITIGPSFNGAAKAAKASPASVHYRPATGAQRCGNCMMIRPDADGGWQCTLVAGPIDPDATCDRWYPKDAAKSADGPVAAGLAVRAADTGRVLMLQRAYDDDDPAGGYWEMPGGRLDDGEDALGAAKREWAEETGCTVPDGELTGVWSSSNGVYRGFVLTVPSEDMVDILGPRDEVDNPDDEDGDLVESLAWFDPKQLRDNPSIRPELAEDQKRVRRALKSAAGNAETLREYWAHQAHPGPSQFAMPNAVAWGAPGDFDRCTQLAMEHAHMAEEQAHGWCNLEHHRALGFWPAQHARMEREGTP